MSNYHNVLIYDLAVILKRYCAVSADVKIKQL